MIANFTIDLPNNVKIEEGTENCGHCNALVRYDFARKAALPRCDDCGRVVCSDPDCKACDIFEKKLRRWENRNERRSLRDDG